MNRAKSVNLYNRSLASETDRISTLNAMGNLSNINPTSIPNGVPLSTSYLPNSMPPANNSSIPPPVPPRPMTTSRSMMQGGYSGYNSYYSPYSRFSGGMYGPMGSYGGFRSPYSPYGAVPPGSYNSFIQLAEESTRPAFESIESVVDIVGSISMMLESTYHAVHSSYSAIIGVVDQFSRLKDHLAEVLSFLALIRGLKYLCYKILYILRLRKDNPSVEAAWKTAASGSNVPGFSSDKKSPWPFFMFVGLVIGAPWLMFKLLAKSVALKKPFDLKAWETPDGRLICCCTAFSFNTNRRGELSFTAGEKLYIAPNHLQNVPRGWLLACNNKMEVGLIPRNYLKKITQVNSPRPIPNSEVTNPSENCVENVPPDLCNDASLPAEDQGSLENLPDPFSDKI